LHIGEPFDKMYIILENDFTNCIYLSLVSRNLEEWESDEDEEFGKSL